MKFCFDRFLAISITSQVWTSSPRYRRMIWDPIMPYLPYTHLQFLPIALPWIFSQKLRRNPEWAHAEDSSTMEFRRALLKCWLIGSWDEIQLCSQASLRFNFTTSWVCAGHSEWAFLIDVSIISVGEIRIDSFGLALDSPVSRRGYR